MMEIELKRDYYIDYLQKVRRKLGNPWSIAGRHHANVDSFVRSALDSVPAGSSVLDAGCGISQWVTPEVRERYSLYGVDVQPEAIEACRALYPGSDYRVGDLYNLDFPTAHFDAVTMREVIEHFETPERAVQEMRRILKPGGRFVLTTPNYDNPLVYIIDHTYGRIFGGNCKAYLDEVHPSRFRVDTLRELVAKYFEVEEYRRISLGITLTCIARKR